MNICGTVMLGYTKKCLGIMKTLHRICGRKNPYRTIVKLMQKLLSLKKKKNITSAAKKVIMVYFNLNTVANLKHYYRTFIWDSDEFSCIFYEKEFVIRVGIGTALVEGFQYSFKVPASSLVSQCTISESWVHILFSTIANSTCGHQLWVSQFQNFEMLFILYIVFCL